MTPRLRTPKPDFKKRESNDFDSWCYDPEFDADLIEASLASQYGIRLRQEPDISYAEYARLLSGLMSETPLGRVIQVRMEKDSKVIQKMSRGEKKLRNDWAVFKAKHRKNTFDPSFDMRKFQESLKNLSTVKGGA